ncbi:MAG: hypothetical protein K940chlam8_01225 [Chlamydiae bacterium]|nr:hypothetical protein [Chlamydiota bacterium]
MTQNDQEVFDKYKQEKPWGMNVSIDLHDCDPNLIKLTLHTKSNLGEERKR